MSSFIIGVKQVSSLLSTTQFLLVTIALGLSSLLVVSSAQAVNNRAKRNSEQTDFNARVIIKNLHNNVNI